MNSGIPGAWERSSGNASGCDTCRASGATCAGSADGSCRGPHFQDERFRFIQQHSDLTPRLPPRRKPRAVSCS